jgi:hypothetical protein
MQESFLQGRAEEFEKVAGGLEQALEKKANR